MEYRVKRNLHFVTDSPYTNWYHDRIGALSPRGVENIFISYVPERQFIARSQIVTFNHSEKSFNDLLQRINDGYYNTIYINFLEEWQSTLVEKILDPNVTIVWIIWSADLYEIPIVAASIYDRFSAKYVSGGIINIIKEKYKNIRYMYSWKRELNRKKVRAIKKIHYCCTGIEREFLLVKHRLNDKIKWIKFSFLDANELIPVECREFDFLFHKSDLLVGNSSDPRNNHYEILKLIRSLKLSNKIILPLAYGDKLFSDHLINSVNGWFSANQLVIVRQFLPREKYYELLSNVKVAIFGHRIQQAYGNILGLICMGVKVFLQKTNVLYAEFIDWGVVVYKIDDLTNSSCFDALPIEVALKNREIILERYSETNVNQFYKTLLLT
jgi:hypothetical protein